MNLHALAGPIVASVNPWAEAIYRQSAGPATTRSDGVRTPNYAAGVEVRVQKQALTFKDLEQLSGLNIQGEKAAMYVDGDWKGVARPDMRGGDLITLTADGSVWLVSQVLENWASTAGWTKVAVTRQNGA